MVDENATVDTVEVPPDNAVVATALAQAGTIVIPQEKTMAALRRMESAIGKALNISAKNDRDAGGALLAIRVFKLWKLHTVKSAAGRDIPEYSSFSKYCEAMWPQSQARVSQLVKAANEANIAINATLPEDSEKLPVMVIATRNTTARATTYPVLAGRIVSAMDKNVTAWQSQLEQCAALEDADAQAEFNETLADFFEQWGSVRETFVEMSEFVDDVPASADSATVAES